MLYVICYPLQYSGASLVSQLVENPSAVWEIWVGDLGLKPGLGRSPGEGKERLPTPIFWPGEFHGLYSPCGCKKSGTTEQLSLLLICYLPICSLFKEYVIFYQYSSIGYLRWINYIKVNENGACQSKGTHILKFILFLLYISSKRSNELLPT